VNRRQRIVLVVVLGAVAVIGAVLVNRLLAGDDEGWFAYAPSSAVAYGPQSTSVVWRDALVWLAATAIWGAVSLWLLRSSAGSED